MLNPRTDPEYKVEVVEAVVGLVMAVFFGAMSLDHTGTQACFAPCVTSPLPAKKSTRLGGGGVMTIVEEFEGGGRRGALGSGRGEMLHCGD